MLRHLQRLGRKGLWPGGTKGRGLWEKVGDMVSDDGDLGGFWCRRGGRERRCCRIVVRTTMVSSCFALFGQSQRSGEWILLLLLSNLC